MKTNTVKNRPFSIHTIHDMIGSDDVMVRRDGLPSVRAVPAPYPGGRLIAALWVMRGKAHAVRWPHPGEFEAAAGVPVKKPE